MKGNAAIGRVPVVSANGEPLMPCKPAKATSLLKSGKAVGKRTDNGAFYLHLKFNPMAPIIHPRNSLIKSNPSIQYEELVSARKAGDRNGKLYKLRNSKEGRVKEGLLNASIVFLRRGCRIVSSKVKEALNSIVETLQPACTLIPIPRSRILRKGRERAVALLNECREANVFSWAPQISEWLKSEAYSLWLGINQISSPDYGP